MRFFFGIAALAAGVLFACGNPEGPQPVKPPGQTAASGDERAVGSGPVGMINGAGATFPYPVYSQWAYKHERITGQKLNYQSIGSGGGIAQVKAGTVDFGASDAPMKKEELDAAGLVQFPMVIGGVVPVVNAEGIGAGQLKLTGEALARIYIGSIAKWNDPALAALNPGLKLPDADITSVHRADGSGTTWIFTNYLAAVSPEWKEKIGAEKAVSWPGGVGGKGNEGVASYVQRVPGSIGYVEYAYALQNNMAHVLLKNQAGEFIAPTIGSFQAAAANADWAGAPGYYVVLIDQPGAGTWPIAGASFILLHREQSDVARAKGMLDFFDWCYGHGAEIAKELHYVPMPENVIALVRETWRNEIASGGAAIWQ